MAHRRPRRHPPARGPGPGPAHAARRGAAVRGVAGAGGAADADVRGGARRGVACPSADRAPAAAPRKYRQRAAFRGEEERRTRLVAELRQARLTGIRVAVPVEALEARLSGLPAGVSVEPGRIEVRFSGAQDAVGRLFALAQALTHDYERFETLVEGGRPGRRRGSGAGMNDDVVRVELTDIARTARAQRAELVLPRLIVDAGPVAVEKFLEFSPRGSRTGGRARRTGEPWGSFWRGARRGGWGSRRSRRCTWRPTSGTHPGSAPTCDPRGDPRRLRLSGV